MRGEVKTNFYKLLQEEFPETYKKIQQLYRNDAYVSKEYSQKLRKYLYKLREKYGIDGGIRMKKIKGDLLDF
jgi:hypothetical protein